MPESYAPDEPAQIRVVWGPQSFDAEAKKAYDAIKGPLVPIMEEGATRETRVFARGNRLAKEQAVTPGLPKLFGGATGEDMNRLDMAKWLVGEDNPLSFGGLIHQGFSRDFDPHNPPTHGKLLNTPHNWVALIRSDG